MSDYRHQPQTPRYYREQRNLDDLFPPPPRNPPQGYGQQGYGVSMKVNRILLSLLCATPLVAYSHEPVLARKSS